MEVDNHEGGEDWRVREESGSNQGVQSRPKRFSGMRLPRRVDELTLRAGKAEQLCTFIDATNVGTSRWGPPPCARRLACNLSGQLVECRRRRGEEPVLQVCGDEQESQFLQPRWHQQGKHALNNV